MELGPFRVDEIDRIQEIMTSHEVPYEFYVDEDLKLQLLKQFQEMATQAPSQTAGTLDLRIVFFEIEDSDFVKIQTAMEKLGIAPASDGSWELGEDS